jgi:hypothetical protein
MPPPGGRAGTLAAPSAVIATESAERAREGGGTDNSEASVFGRDVLAHLVSCALGSTSAAEPDVSTQFRRNQPSCFGEADAATAATLV